jgi:hypothetical protein
MNNSISTLHSGGPGKRFSSRALFAICWVSCTIFGIYILVFYGGAILVETMEDWNQVLPRLYDATSQSASLMIGAHFFAGAIVLVLGPLQFIQSVRTRWPTLHRFNGRIYAVAALMAGLGGVAYLILRGAVGGAAMNIGFGGYGVLTLLAAVNTVRHARARRIEQHRAWAIRLFALGIGSWLYRMDYGIWLKLFGGPGHTHTFDGLFDGIMDFFFYIPNLIVAEAVIRARQRGDSRTSRFRKVPHVLGIAAVLVAVATFLFTRSYWAPHIAERLAPLFHVEK